jgi:hypothetical protein
MEARLTLAETKERERLTEILVRRGEITPPEPRREQAPQTRQTKAKEKPPAAVRKGKRQKPERVKSPWRGGK